MSLVLYSTKTPHFSSNTQNVGIGSKRRRDTKKKIFKILRNAKKKFMKESLSGIFRSLSFGRKGRVFMSYFLCR